MDSSTAQNRNFLSTSYNSEPSSQQQKNESFTTKFRQTIKSAGKHKQDSHQINTSESDLNNLNPKSQELILRAVDKIRKDDSQHVLNTLDESRNILRSTLEEFKREQDECRRQLEEILKYKETRKISKENAIPLSIFMRRKRDIDETFEIRSSSTTSSTYQAYFEALLSTDQNNEQHPTDKAAVLKYLRRRERRKRAEENKKNHQLSDDILEKQTAELILKMEGVDIKLEHERERQNQILRARMNENKIKTNNIIQANEIIDQANEAALARQRVEKTHRGKIEARLSAVRHLQNRNPKHMIHVQSNLNENDDEKLNEEQIETTKKSLQLLNNNIDEHQQIRSTTKSVYGGENTKDKVATIDI
ncbi:unnamed protein product [Rotaria sp. Silwood2]|nr:unnamed protein product [Rotaria sp. Silwood2]CAF2512836.1 unnamed protein product [Rotaria sp. Silwood2]CAF4118543.1 unnamed protein product [Rotaria sp. Silwood2]CAF4468934.1 unnamed protein product [Rotaria sp. Silwood2]